MSLKLGRKWKCRPSILLPPKTVSTIMDVDGPGIIRHIWLTVDERVYRNLVLRMYWDSEKLPSVEVPIGDFFCNGYPRRTNVLAIPINVNPNGGYNCYFPMPFRKHARITVENLDPKLKPGMYYSIDYTLGPVTEECGYFHAQFRRQSPDPKNQDYVILDGVKGRGQFVGVYMAWQHEWLGWWGEGELKAFIDGDTEFPTICGTGTEDYFGGAWGFGQGYSAPYLGYQRGEDVDRKGENGLYRFHILDPIYFQKDLRIAIQTLGAMGFKEYCEFEDDIASVAYWYQSEPHEPFPKLPDLKALQLTKKRESSGEN
jgi:hypothetical protein